MPLETGARLGPYKILAALGAGGMGEVHRAHDPLPDRGARILTIKGTLFDYQKVPVRSHIRGASHG